MKKIFTSAILAALFTGAVAQSSYSVFQYSLGFSTGNLNDFISKMSPRGFTFDYRLMKYNNVGVGLDVGWNIFYDDIPDDTYTTGNYTFSGKQYRYSNHVPVLLSADYFFLNDGKLLPFAGLGIGTMYTRRTTDMGLFTFEDTAWHFALRPEAGVIFKTDSYLSFSLIAKYYYGLKAGPLEAQSYFTVGLGVALTR